MANTKKVYLSFDGIMKRASKIAIDCSIISVVLFITFSSVVIFVHFTGGSALDPLRNNGGTDEPLQDVLHHKRPAIPLLSEETKVYDLEKSFEALQRSFEQKFRALEIRTDQRFEAEAREQAVGKVMFVYVMGVTITIGIIVLVRFMPFFLPRQKILARLYSDIRTRVTKSEISPGSAPPVDQHVPRQRNTHACCGGNDQLLRDCGHPQAD